MTDAQLLEQAQEGDRQAWRQLYERLFPSVWRAAMLRLGNTAAVEDVVSETFLAMVEKLDSLEPDSCRLHGWTHRVMHNKVNDYLRKRHRHARAVEHLGIGQANRSDALLGPADESLAQERRGMIVKVLESLREDQRLVLELKYAEGLSVRDIAERVGGTEKAVESLLYRSRQEFRQKFDHLVREPEPAVPARPMQDS